MSCFSDMRLLPPLIWYLKYSHRNLNGLTECQRWQSGESSQFKIDSVQNNSNQQQSSNVTRKLGKPQIQSRKEKNMGTEDQGSHFHSTLSNKRSKPRGEREGRIQTVQREGHAVGWNIRIDGSVIPNKLKNSLAVCKEKFMLCLDGGNYRLLIEKWQN